MLRFKLIPLLAAGLFIALAAAACGPVGAPDIQLSSDRIDLGTLTNGEVEEFQVDVRNTGNAPLMIEAVTTSCGCTSASVSPQTIQPGQVVTLSVTYDSGAHGPEFTGEVERQVFIASNDPETREVVFNVKVNVVSPDR